MVGLVWVFIIEDMVCGAPVATGMVTAMVTEEVIIMGTGEAITRVGAPDTVQVIDPEVVTVPICTEIVPPVFDLRDPRGIPQPEIIRRERNHDLRVNPIICTPIRVEMCTGNKIMGMYSSGRTANGKAPVRTVQDRARSTGNLNPDKGEVAIIITTTGAEAVAEQVADQEEVEAGEGSIFAPHLWGPS
jgi:hypothetical protein